MYAHNACLVACYDAHVISLLSLKYLKPSTNSRFTLFVLLTAVVTFLRYVHLYARYSYVQLHIYMPAKASCFQVTNIQPSSPYKTFTTHLMYFTFPNIFSARICSAAATMLHQPLLVALWLLCLHSRSYLIPVLSSPSFSQQLMFNMTIFRLKYEHNIKRDLSHNEREFTIETIQLRTGSKGVGLFWTLGVVLQG
jgi:hypothetical protein